VIAVILCFNVVTKQYPAGSDACLERIAQWHPPSRSSGSSAGAPTRQQRQVLDLMHSAAHCCLARVALPRLGQHLWVPASLLRGSSIISPRPMIRPGHRLGRISGRDFKAVVIAAGGEAQRMSCVKIFTAAQASSSHPMRRLPAPAHWRSRAGRELTWSWGITGAANSQVSHAAFRCDIMPSHSPDK